MESNIASLFQERNQLQFETRRAFYLLINLVPVNASIWIILYHQQEDERSVGMVSPVAKLQLLTTPSVAAASSLMPRHRLCMLSFNII
jgi:hypothetical protein